MDFLNSLQQLLYIFILNRSTAIRKLELTFMQTLTFLVFTICLTPLLNYNVLLRLNISST